MYQITLLNELLKNYKIWHLKLKNTTKNIEDNILQKDSYNKIEEKIISIAISSFIVWIVTSILALFSIKIHFIGSVFFFVVGWLLSKGINKKVFGTQRNFEDLKDEEKELLNILNRATTNHQTRIQDINDEKISVHFTNYIDYQKEFLKIIDMLQIFNTSHLAIKYKMKHPYLIKKYQANINFFDKIYANKRTPNE